MNVLLTNLSILPNREPKTVNYKCNIFGTETTVEGIQTNEAAAKYYISKLCHSNEQLDEIICLASGEVLDSPLPIPKYSGLPSDGSEKITTADFFKKRLEKYCIDNNYFFPKFKFIRLGDDNIIPQAFVDEISSIDSLSVYIDTTGGKRDDVNRLQLLVKFLSYKGIEIKETVYSNFVNSDSASDESRIENVDIYDIMKILDGVNQFTDSGQSRILSDIFTDDTVLSPLIYSMNRFAESLLLCQTENIDNELSEIDDQLSVAEKNITNDNNKHVLFKQLIPLIRDKFFINSSDRYISLIEWCLKNNLIQQAITIYVEKIPDSLFRQGVFVYTDTKNTYTSNYSRLYEGMLSLQDNSTHDINRITTIYNKYKKDLMKSEGTILQDKIKQLIDEIKNNNPIGKKIFDKLFYPYKFDERKFKKNYDIKKYENFNKFLSDTLRPTTLNIISEICSKPVLLRELSDCYSKEPQMINNTEQSSFYRKFLTIRNLQYWCDAGNIKLKNGLSTNYAMQILSDYLFIKSLRNLINHANSLNMDFIPTDFEYFSLKNKLDLANIKKDFSLILERLKEVLDTNS